MRAARLRRGCRGSPGRPCHFRGRRLLDATLAEAIPVQTALSSAPPTCSCSRPDPHGVAHAPLSSGDRAPHGPLPAGDQPGARRAAPRRARERYDELSATLAARAADPSATPSVCVIRPPAGITPDRPARASHDGAPDRRRARACARRGWRSRARIRSCSPRCARIHSSAASTAPSAIARLRRRRCRIRPDDDRVGDADDLVDRKVRESRRACGSPRGSTPRRCRRCPPNRRLLPAHSCESSGRRRASPRPRPASSAPAASSSSAPDAQPPRRKIT